MSQVYQTRRKIERESGGMYREAAPRQALGVPADNFSLEETLCAGAASSDEGVPGGGRPSLGAHMQSRMVEHFGPGVIQMKRPGQPSSPCAGSADSIIASLEARSGVDLSGVEIHRDSPKPAQIGALAYAQGEQVYLGPGQDAELGHELTHVVQQKQGMVRSTGTVDGLPVNTSPALERAADAMQVSAAPEAAAQGPGIVQGVFVDPSGKPHSSSDVEGMKRMLDGSIESMIARVQESQMSGSERRRALKALTTAKKKLGKRLDKAHKSNKKISAADELTAVLNDAFSNMKMKKSDSLDMQRLMVDTMGSREAVQVYFDDVLRSQDTGAGVQQSMSGFQLPTQAAEGIGDIGEYDPSDAMEELTEGRMGNSASLAASQATTPEAQAKREQSIQQFNDGTAVARRGAAAMKEDPNSISFSTLMDLFSSINTQVRGGADDAGKLRGQKVTVGQLTPPRAAALPEDAYRTFSVIADKMREIHANPDKKLAKTQAIHLAAFAYQMTISEHMFADGNGRTCRLFADSILQSFGLPPSTPVKELGEVGANIGSDMDFQAGAAAVMAGVRLSDQTLKQNRPEQPAAPQAESQRPAEVTGSGFLSDPALEARASAGESDYSGPVTPISTTSSALSAAGPMHAKKPKGKGKTPEISQPLEVKRNENWGHEIFHSALTQRDKALKEEGAKKDEIQQRFMDQMKKLSEIEGGGKVYENKDYDKGNGKKNKGRRYTSIREAALHQRVLNMSREQLLEDTALQDRVVSGFNSRMGNEMKKYTGTDKVTAKTRAFRGNGIGEFAAYNDMLKAMVPQEMLSTVYNASRTADPTPVRNSDTEQDTTHGATQAVAALTSSLRQNAPIMRVLNNAKPAFAQSRALGNEIDASESLMNNFALRVFGPQYAQIRSDEKGNVIINRAQKFMQEVNSGNSDAAKAYRELLITAPEAPETAPEAPETAPEQKSVKDQIKYYNELIQKNKRNRNG